MSDSVLVKEGEIFVGKAMAWPAYDRNGRLLLQQGEIISSRRQLEILLKRGLYRRASDRHGGADAPLDHPPSNPFEVLADLRQRIPSLTSALLLGQEEARDRAARISRDLQTLCEFAPDAALGSIHLCKDVPYSVCHPLHTALLCELVGKRAGFEVGERQALICAALTQNLAMLDLQDRLRQQPEALRPEQRATVDAHPARSVEILRSAGVEDPIWLSAVEQHHERLDGSGYPRGLRGEQICTHARLLAVTDRYTAMVSERAYRPAMTAKTALRHFLDDSQTQFDPQFRVMMIKELGIYPPGSWVRLANGEIGVVVKRREHATQPVVGATVNARGGPYVRPMRRETANESYRIEEVLPSRNLSFNPATLWS